jgi:hypothetical protein
MAVKVPAVASYDERLRTDRSWARREVDLFFNRENEVFRTLYRLAERLDELDIPYVLIGGLALFHHGFERLTKDIDLVVTPEGLRKIHEDLEGRGYLAVLEGRKELRDTATNVRIAFLVTGQYPGDGKPKPVAFPDPAEQAIAIDGVKVINLPKLIDLKLASGMTNPRRLQDIVDVQRLIENLGLPADLADRLDPSVRDKFLELHRIVTEVPDPYGDP